MILHSFRAAIAYAEWQEQIEETLVSGLPGLHEWHEVRKSVIVGLAAEQ